MLYLFCSAATPLYKRAALESISYPDEHILRYRYAEKYIHPKILKNLKAFDGKEALIVFLDRVGTPATDFAFYPLRKIQVLRLVAAAGAVYFNFRLGEF